MEPHLPPPILGEAVAIDGDALLLVLVGIAVIALLAVAAVASVVWVLVRAAADVRRDVRARRAGRGRA